VSVLSDERKSIFRVCRGILNSCKQRLSVEICLTKRINNTRAAVRVNRELIRWPQKSKLQLKTLNYNSPPSFSFLKVILPTSNSPCLILLVLLVMQIPVVFTSLNKLNIVDQISKGQQIARKDTMMNKVKNAKRALKTEVWWRGLRRRRRRWRRRRRRRRRRRSKSAAFAAPLVSLLSSQPFNY